MCDIECYREACEWDKGDCIECSVGCSPCLLGNGICDSACNTEACGLDGGDCEGECNDQGCKNSWVSDGICDKEC